MILGDTVWHGGKLEALYAIMYHGSLFPSKEIVEGERYFPMRLAYIYIVTRMLTKQKIMFAMYHGATMVFSRLRNGKSKPIDHKEYRRKTPISGFHEMVQ